MLDEELMVEEYNEGNNGHQMPPDLCEQDVMSKKN